MMGERRASGVPALAPSLCRPFSKDLLGVLLQSLTVQSTPTAGNQTFKANQSPPSGRIRRIVASPFEIDAPS
jgi:hypothetical protein